MEINYIENIASTHLHVIESIKNNSKKPPFALYANSQYDGIGSRQNNWLGDTGNLYFTFCIYEKEIPQDVPSASISIYFACIMREKLALLGSKVWLKWPNDFYVNNKKVGGLMTSKIKDIFIVSVGINLVSSPQEFGILDIKITNHELVKAFVDEMKIKYSWKKVFSKFTIEFQNSKDFTFHEAGRLRFLGEAVLCDDGSIKIDGKKVYSLR